MSNSSFTGRDRARATPRSVRTKERIARLFISLGGIGTIVAVSLIFAFLLWVVVPLFGGASLGDEVNFDPAVASAAEGSLASGMDEFGLMGWTLSADGTLTTFRAGDGTLLKRTKLFEARKPICWAFAPNDQDFAFGYADGTIQVGKIAFARTFLERDDVSEQLGALKTDAVARYEDGLIQATPTGQLRYEHLAVTFADEPIEIEDAPRMLDYSILPSGESAFAVLSDSGLAFYVETQRENMLTGEIIKEFEATPIPYEPIGGRPHFLTLNGVGTHVVLTWKSGEFIRFDVSDALNPREAERGRFVPEGVAITYMSFQIGKTSLLVGDSAGRVGAWFASRPDGAGTVDGAVLVRAHELIGPDARVTTVSPSTRSRMTAVGYDNGEVRLFYVTSGALLLHTEGGSGPVRELKLAPKENALLALGDSSARVWKLDAGFPEATFASLFRAVHYEGAAKPEHVWQSTGGTDDFEPKFGLYPLIFGTLKATLYSILIAAPIALFAAIFTSEFLTPRFRAPVKSTIEMMASLPSVVLGFLAALVIAPFVQKVLPGTLMAFLTVPFCFLLGARLWQLLPTRTAIRLGGLPRVGFQFVALVVGVLLAGALGPPLERWLFNGDAKRWLGDPSFGSATGGWFFLMLPLCAVGVSLLTSQLAGPWLRQVSIPWSRFQCAVVDLGKFIAVFAVGVLLAYASAVALGAVGWDPRGGVLGSYAQRNAMIVGFVMGFAIVPIIYTLAEDALTSVPTQLREGSLGAGATQWQTAWRIVIPAAMSGLFGALMVGLGRAVGETMIVLMAAGNTPILDLNPFNGFRTLSANIAVELPEAVKDSTHYRTLFLAAFVLFLMTFTINIFAEWVRRVFRRRFEDL